MTIYKDKVCLWDNGKEKLYTVSVPVERQYKYINNEPCITVGFIYENNLFRGYDEFTFFGNEYINLVETIKDSNNKLSGFFHLYDMGSDTDGYIDVHSNKGKVIINSQLGASFSSHSLKFSFEADQTLLQSLIKSIKPKDIF